MDLINISFVSDNDDVMCQQGRGGPGGNAGGSGSTLKSRAGGFKRNPTMNESKGNFINKRKKGYAASQRRAKAKLAAAAQGTVGTRTLIVGGAAPKKTASDFSGNAKSRVGKKSGKLPRRLLA